jgi:hypothetical protein
MMKRLDIRLPQLVVVAAVVALAGVPLCAGGGGFTVFDAPGAVLGTVPYAINPAGAVAGYYLDATPSFHGFARTPDGTLTTFDAPGAGSGFAQGTQSLGINPAGAITGQYIDANCLAHGFVRAPSGAIIKFDAPGAGTAPGVCSFGIALGTSPGNINPAGVIAGSYSDSSGVYHGFVRAANGTITTFDAPGAGTGPGQGTFTASASGINPEGTVTGNYVDANNVNHGYVRAPNGTITTFDPPGAGAGPGQGTYTVSISPNGEIACFYLDGDNVYHGSLRAAYGGFTGFDVAGAGTAAYQGTLAEGINPSGEITGTYYDSGYVMHGFVRSSHGAITTFDAPDAGTAAYQGTYAGSNNPAGTITGYFVNGPPSLARGYLFKP